MLSTEENDLLIRTNRATPGGEFMRCYWQPVGLSEELPEGGEPLSLKILGEELVLFRDDQGKVGLLGLHCSHRGADLSLGRIEDGGLRCLYHGWLYDIQGRCLEQPAEPSGSDFKNKIRQRAYPCRELGGLIFAYMGKGEPPELPNYEPLVAPENHRFAYKVLHECNWLQAHEGEIDPAHLSYLHRRLRQPSWRQRSIQGSDGLQPMTLYRADAAPRVEVEETDFGVRIYSMRQAGGDKVYLRVTNSIFPNVSTIIGPMAGDGYDVNWHVPIDDTNHWKFVVIFRRSGALEARDWKNINSVKEEMTPDYRLVRNAGNKYLQDRESMKTWNICGMGTNNLPQDGAMVQSAGPIQDREEEHLGTTDKAIIANRKALLRAIQQTQAGKEPPHAMRDVEQREVRQIAVISEMIPATEEWKQYPRKVAEARSRADRLA